MTKQKSLCLRCRSYMCLRLHATTLQDDPFIATVGSCKQALLDHRIAILADSSDPCVTSCSEFSNINPGISINVYLSRFKSGIDDFIVQATGEYENELYPSFEDTMEAAADLLKKELIKHKGDSHTI